jgi:hypothetical protein
MNNRNQYVLQKSEQILQRAIKEYNLDINNDPQLYELIRGISLIHASKQYEDQFIIENAFTNIKYNINQEFSIVPHGLIQIETEKPTTIPRNFNFRSFDSIYKSIDMANINSCKIVSIQMLNRYGRKFVEIKLMGEINGKLEFFAPMNTVNQIFENNESINMSTYVCKRKIRGSIFENLNCNYLTTFYIDHISSSQQFTLHIPVNHNIDNLHDIHINCIIVSNRFEIISNPSINTIQIPNNTDPVQIKSLLDVHNQIIPHKKINENGWHITENNGVFYTNIATKCTAVMTCKNTIPNTNSCQPETFLSSTETKWLIKPINRDVFIQFAEYLTSNAIEMFQYLTKLCNLDYEKIHVESTILERIHEEKYYLCERGHVIQIETQRRNYVLWSLIEQEINKYHNIKIQLGVINE